MPPNNDGVSKKTRCKWYNDVGNPRINPDRVRRGWSSSTGCTRTADRCWYAHPDHPDWKTAALSPYLQPKDYPDGRVPRTPEPPPRKRSRSRSSERRISVKEEPGSPTLRYNFSDKDRTPLLSKRVGPRRSASPFRGERDRGWARNPITTSNGPTSRNYSREGGKYDYKRPRKYSKEREWDKNKKTYDYDRKGNSREQDRDRRASDSSKFGSFSNLSNSHKRAVSQSPPLQPTGTTDESGSVLNRLFDRDPGLGYTPKGPSSLRGLLTSLGLDSNLKTSNDTAQIQDTSQASGSVLTPLPQRPPSPSIPPPPPPHIPEPIPPVARPPSSQSRSSIASSTTIPAPSSNTFGVPPEVLTSAIGAAMSMLPPPTPVSTASTSTLVAPLSAASVPPTNPYVVPPKPMFLASSQAPVSLKKEELTREERAAIWDKRIELLSEAVAAKRAYTERLADSKQLHALAAPDRTTNLPPAVRDQVNTSLQTAQAQVDAAAERIKSSQQKILELDFWPVRHRPDEYDPVKKDQIKVEQEEKLKQRKLVEDEQAEIKERMSVLSDTIFKLDKQMKEVALLVSARARLGGGSTMSTSAPPESESMDWEPGEIRQGLKRRRIGDDSAYASDSASATLGPMSPSLASNVPPLTGEAVVGSASTGPLSSSSSSIHLRVLGHRLTKLESSYHELENLFNQDEAQRQEELVAIIETQVDRSREEILRSARSGQSERVKKLGEEMGQMDKEVQELAGEVADLIERVAGVQSVQNRAEEERARVEAESVKVRAAIEENASRTSAMQAQLVANIEETQSLRQALTLAIQSSTVTSVPPPYIPSIEELTQALLPHLVKVIRTDIDQRLQEQKADVVKILRENIHGNYGTQQQMDKLREMLERVSQLPDVMSVLRSSGALGSVNNTGANGSGNYSGTTNGSGMGVNTGIETMILQANGSTQTPKPSHTSPA